MKVLIVEDDDTLRSAYETVLTMEGFEVFVADDGLEGLRLVAEEQPDVVLLDMLLPKLDGLEFLESLKGQDPRPKILLCSNMALPRDVKKARELGADRYLIKSNHNPKELIEIIQSL